MAANKYLDIAGLRQLWNRINALFAKKTDVPDVSIYAKKTEIPDVSGLEENVESLTASVDSATQLVPNESAVVGKILKVKSVNADGTFVCEWATEQDISGKADRAEIPDISGKADRSELPSVPVKEVQVAGTALVPDENGAVNVPLATDSNGLYGVHKTVGYSYGIESINGLLQVYPAGDSAINARTTSKLPITPKKLDYAVMKSLTDCKDATLWTEEAQKKCCSTLGAEHTKGEWVLKGTITYDNTNVNVDLTGCTELIIYGSASNIGDNHINSNIGYLHYSAFSKGDKTIFDKFQYDGYATSCVVSKIESNLNKVILNGNSNYAYVLINKSISMITNIYVHIPSNLTYCDIKIYAR